VKPAEAELRDAFDALLDTASVVARFYARDEEEQKKLEQLKVQTQLRGAHEAIKAASAKLEAYPIDEILTLPLELESAHALIDLSKKLEPGARPASNDFEMRLLSEQFVFTPRVAYASAMSQATLREWLLDRLDCSSNPTDCELRRDIEGIIVLDTRKTLKEEKMIIYREAAMMTKSSETLSGAFKRYLRDCICSAFNPSCAPCDDPAVLLACLEVKECDVVKICSLERTFVLSPAAMRYWLPPLSLFGELLEYFCCTDIDELERRFGKAGRYLRIPTRKTASFGATANAAASALYSRVSRIDTSKLDYVTRSISHLFRERDTTSAMIVDRQFAAFSAAEPVEATRVEKPAATAAAAAAAGFNLTADLERVVMEKLTPIIDKQVEVKLARIRKDEAAAAAAAEAKKTAKDKGKDAPASKDKPQ
jgi:hypothetical protein